VFLLVAEGAVELSVLFLGAGLVAGDAERFFVEVVAVGVEFGLSEVFVEGNVVFLG